jgi:hypothetical protein
VDNAKKTGPATRVAERRKEPERIHSPVAKLAPVWPFTDKAGRSDQRTISRVIHPLSAPTAIGAESGGISSACNVLSC